MDAFDADVLIYAAVPGHPLGRRVAALFLSAATWSATRSMSRATGCRPIWVPSKPVKTRFLRLLR